MPRASGRTTPLRGWLYGVHGFGQTSWQHASLLATPNLGRAPLPLRRLSFHSSVCGNYSKPSPGAWKRQSVLPRVTAWQRGRKVKEEFRNLDLPKKLQVAATRSGILLSSHHGLSWQTPTRTESLLSLSLIDGQSSAYLKQTIYVAFGSSYESQPVSKKSTEKYLSFRCPVKR